MNKKILSIILVIILAGIVVMFLAFRPIAPTETQPLKEVNPESPDQTGTLGGTVEGTNSSPSLPPSGTVLTARLNQTVSFAGGTGTVTEILEDSRCPVDVQCIQAGTVRIKVKFSYGSLNQSVNLTLNQPYSMFGRSITLTDVAPEPRSTEARLPGDYMFTLLVK